MGLSSDEIPNLKHQTSNKFQISISNVQNIQLKCIAFFQRSRSAGIDDPEHNDDTSDTLVWNFEFSVHFFKSHHVCAGFATTADNKIDSPKADHKFSIVNLQSSIPASPGWVIGIYLKFVFWCL